MSGTSNRRWVLARRPTGVPTTAAFALEDCPRRDPRAGEVAVRVAYLSVDPYMRGRMRAVDTSERPWVPAFEESWDVGDPIGGVAVGRVVESRHPDFAEGDAVFGRFPWTEYATVPGASLRPIDADLAPLSAWLGVLGRPGIAAYVGLLEVGEPTPGETVCISAAAGAVGTTAGQLANLVSCRTVGIAGSDRKVRLLEDELGFDAAINYETAALPAAVAAACPDGVDVYLDNVGGEITDAVVANLARGARVAVSGQVALYNEEETPTGPRHTWRILLERARVEGFSVLDHEHRFDRLSRALGGLLQDGLIDYRQTVAEGLDAAPDAFVGLFSGENVGKQVVRVDPAAD